MSYFPAFVLMIGTLTVVACSSSAGRIIWEKASPDAKLAVRILHKTGYGSDGAVAFDVVSKGSTQAFFQLGQGGAGAVCLASVAWADNSERAVVLIVPCYRTPFVQALKVVPSGVEQANVSADDRLALERQLRLEYGREVVEGDVLAWVQSSKAWGMFSARLASNRTPGGGWMQ